MKNIVSPSTEHSTVSTRNTLTKLAKNFVANGFLNNTQLDAAKSIMSVCTLDNPCMTPNCKTCSQSTYQRHVTNTSSFIRRSSANNSVVFAVTITSSAWSYDPPYYLDSYLDESNLLIDVLYLYPQLRWIFQHDIAVHGLKLQPHLHGTVSGDDACSVMNIMQAAMAVASPNNKYSIDVTPLPRSQKLKQVHDDVVESWSKYSHKMQCINNRSCRDADDSNNILTLRLLSNTLFCDQPTYFSNYKPADPFPYKLYDCVVTAFTELAAFGAGAIAQSLEQMLSARLRNSDVLKKIHAITTNKQTLTTLRDCLNRCIVSDGSAFCKKLLLTMLTSAAFKINDVATLKKLDGYWPTPDTSLNERHMLAQWLDLLTSTI